MSSISETLRLQRNRIRVLLLLLPVAIALASFSIPVHADSEDAFMGDSITQGWSFPRANFGIHGQTSAQMLQRFSGQIVGKGYRKVYVLAGTNDTLLGVDPRTTVANLSTMVDLAREDHIEPVLAEIPPIHRNNGAYAPQVKALNAQITQMAAAKGLTMIDYYGALDGHATGYVDGVHMRFRNYFRMELALLHPATALSLQVAQAQAAQTQATETLQRARTAIPTQHTQPIQRTAPKPTYAASL